METSNLRGCLKELLLESDLYRQYNIIRYNSLDTIKRQNLGEHHAVVAQLTIMLLENLSTKFKISERTKYLALAGAVSHDLGEISFGDMNIELKREIPELSEISNVVEHNFIKSINGIGNAFGYAQEDEIARTVYKLADALDLILFVNRERKLGNPDPYLDNIIKGGTDTANKLLTKIETLLGVNLGV